MAAPTDLVEKVQGSRATFLPGYVAATIIEFSEVSLQPGGGYETTAGEDVTGGADFVAGVATGRMGGSRKIMHKPFTVEVMFSAVQDAEIKAAMGENGRGTFVVTFVDGATRTNASVDLIDWDVASDTVSDSGKLTATATFQPSGDAEWVNVAAA